MKTIAFAVCADMPDLTPSDAILAAELRARGARVEAAPWSGPENGPENSSENGSGKALAALFERADLVVVRSTWDYDRRPEAFAAWLGALEALESAGRAVVNSPRLMRWNMDKRYLLELAEKGAPLAPTRAVAPQAASIGEAMAALGLERAVVKPCIGAGARGLALVEAGDPRSLERAARALDGGRGLAQAFIPEIETRGEISMIFVDGALSHAVVKRPACGDIRVQEEHGGRTAPTRPPAFAVEAAARLLDLLPEPAVYARIDGVVLDGGFRLMEVELIEPELFFTYFPSSGAAARFADALMTRL